MRDLTIGDRTQRLLLPRLERTEELLARAASRVNAKACDAEVVALSDLGLATNVSRMLGGFFTGALYRWEGANPLVPVDATVNVCSVSIHRVASAPSSSEDFAALVHRARERCAKETGYSWNLAVGNHFASLGNVVECDRLPDGDYLVLHASASEYKRTPHGLYPSPDVWFADRIQVMEAGGRRLRYLTGGTAERFIERAHSLVDYNAARHDAFASLIGEELGVDHVECTPHYGMPDYNSVAIGCHWLAADSPGWYLLLTEPEVPIPIVQPAPGANVVRLGAGERTLTPHGLGVRSRSGRIEIGEDGISLGDAGVERDGAVLANADTEWRSLRRDAGLLDRILETAPGKVVGWYTPRFSYYRSSQN